MPENMDVSEGFQIEKPNVFVPWSTSSRELVTMFRDLDLKQVNNDYIVTQCVSLKGLSHKLGFHFDLRPGFGIRYFELFDNGCQGNALSFLTFQKHLEATFGKPTTAARGEGGFPSYTWQRDSNVVLHRIQERFGLQRSCESRDPHQRLNRFSESAEWVLRVLSHGYCLESRIIGQFPCFYGHTAQDEGVDTRKASYYCLHHGRKP